MARSPTKTKQHRTEQNKTEQSTLTALSTEPSFTYHIHCIHLLTHTHEHAASTLHFAHVHSHMLPAFEWGGILECTLVRSLSSGSSPVWGSLLGHAWPASAVIISHASAAGAPPSYHVFMYIYVYVYILKSPPKHPSRFGGAEGAVQVIDYRL